MMTRNAIIRSTLLINKFLFWLFLLFLSLFVLLILHSTISPESYKNFLVDTGGNTFDFNLDYCPDCNRNGENIFLSDIGAKMKMWVLVRYSALMVFLILILHRGIKIWESVKEYKTFYNNNSLYFKQIAKFTFIIFLIGTFNFIDEGKNGIGFRLGFPIGWIAFSLVCLTLSEVFKEGYSLKEDNDSMI